MAALSAGGRERDVAGGVHGGEQRVVIGVADHVGHRCVGAEVRDVDDAPHTEQRAVVEHVAAQPHVVADELESAALAGGRQAELADDPAVEDDRVQGLDRGVGGWARQELAAEADRDPGPAAVLAQQRLLAGLAARGDEEPLDEAEAEPLVDDDAHAGGCVGQGRDAIGRVVALLEQDAGLAAALDPHPLRIGRHRRVEPERQLAHARARRLLGEHQQIEILELGGRERLCVAGQPHVVGVDVDVDPGRAAPRERLHEQQHVAERIGELELAQLGPRTRRIEGEGPRPVGLGARAEPGHQIVGHRCSTRCSTSAVSIAASRSRPRRNALVHR